MYTIEHQWRSRGAILIQGSYQFRQVPTEVATGQHQPLALHEIIKESDGKIRLTARWVLLVIFEVRKNAVPSLELGKQHKKLVLASSHREDEHGTAKKYKLNCAMPNRHWLRSLFPRALHEPFKLSNLKDICNTISPRVMIIQPNILDNVGRLSLQQSILNNGRQISRSREGKPWHVSSSPRDVGVIVPFFRGVDAHAPRGKQG